MKILAGLEIWALSQLYKKVRLVSWHMCNQKVVRTNRQAAWGSRARFPFWHGDWQSSDYYGKECGKKYDGLELRGWRSREAEADCSFRRPRSSETLFVLGVGAIVACRRPRGPAYHWAFFGGTWAGKIGKRVGKHVIGGAARSRGTSSSSLTLSCHTLT